MKQKETHLFLYGFLYGVVTADLLYLVHQVLFTGGGQVEVVQLVKVLIPFEEEERNHLNDKF